MSILYNTEATLAERVDECLADDFKHNAIKAAQEAAHTMLNHRDHWKQVVA